MTPLTVVLIAVAVVHEWPELALWKRVWIAVGLTAIAVTKIVLELQARREEVRDDGGVPLD